MIGCSVLVDDVLRSCQSITCSEFNQVNNGTHSQNWGTQTMVYMINDALYWANLYTTVSTKAAHFNQLNSIQFNSIQFNQSDRWQSIGGTQQSIWKSTSYIQFEVGSSNSIGNQVGWVFGNSYWIFIMSYDWLVELTEWLNGNVLLLSQLGWRNVDVKSEYFHFRVAEFHPLLLANWQIRTWQL